MARFNTDGLNDIIEQMQSLGEMEGEAADEMLLAAAEEVKLAWRKAAKVHGHIDTGDMFDSIGYPRKIKNIRDIKTMDIYPQGKDRKGVRNAEKAFILHYGTSKRKGSHWVDTADEYAEKPVMEAMERVWEENLKKKGL